MNSRQKWALDPTKCSRCGGPATDGMKTCPACRERQNKRRQIVRKELISNGTCPYCHMRPILPGKSRCRPCLQAASESRRRRQNVLISMGLCQYCGQNPADKPYLACRQCLNKNNGYVVKSRGKVIEP